MVFWSEKLLWFVRLKRGLLVGKLFEFFCIEKYWLVDFSSVDCFYYIFFGKIFYV